MFEFTHHVFLNIGWDSLKKRGDVEIFTARLSKKVIPRGKYTALNFTLTNFPGMFEIFISYKRQTLFHKI